MLPAGRAQSKLLASIYAFRAEEAGRMAAGAPLGAVTSINATWFRVRGGCRLYPADRAGEDQRLSENQGEQSDPWEIQEHRQPCPSRVETVAVLRIIGQNIDGQGPPRRLALPAWRSV